eukprot:747268-Hanusia_phi.AAC.5
MSPTRPVRSRDRHWHCGNHPRRIIKQSLCHDPIIGLVARLRLRGASEPPTPAGIPGGVAAGEPLSGSDNATRRYGHVSRTVRYRSHVLSLGVAAYGTGPYRRYSLVTEILALYYQIRGPGNSGTKSLGEVVLAQIRGRLPLSDSADGFRARRSRIASLRRPRSGPRSLRVTECDPTDSGTTLHRSTGPGYSRLSELSSKAVRRCAQSIRVPFDLSSPV